MAQGLLRHVGAMRPISHSAGITLEKDQAISCSRRFLSGRDQHTFCLGSDPAHRGETTKYSRVASDQFSIPTGQSLVEVLVALTFIAVFSIGTAGLAVTIVSSSAQAKSMDIAVFLAHDRLETIRNTTYGSITSANFPTQGFGTITVGSPAVAFPDYQRSVSIQDDTPTSGVKRVVVTVSWRSGSVSEEILVGQ